MSKKREASWVANKTCIDHRVLEGLVARGLSGLELALALHTLRNTDGWVDSESPTGRRLAFVASYESLAKTLGATDSGVRKAVRSLMKAKILSEDAAPAGRIGRSYSLNHDVAAWVSQKGHPSEPVECPKKDTPSPGDGCPKSSEKGVPEVTPELSQKGHPNEPPAPAPQRREPDLKKDLKERSKETHNTEGDVCVSSSDEKGLLRDALIESIRKKFYPTAITDKARQKAESFIAEPAACYVEYVERQNGSFAEARVAAKNQIEAMVRQNRKAMANGGIPLAHPAEVILNRAVEELRMLGNGLQSRGVAS